MTLHEISPISEVFLAQGTYGKVYKCSDNTVKKYLNIFEHGTVNEIYMYLKYSACQFIPKLLVVGIEGEQIVLNITYEGPTICDYAKTVTYVKRCALLPYFINQIGEMARWLKARSIIHYDIKPSNLCIDPETHLLKLIDFNFTIPTVRKKFDHCGTYIYCDPSYHKNKSKTHSIQFDIFSFGMCLINWISKTDHDICKVKTNEELRAVINIELYLEGTTIDIMHIILSMIDLNENTRMKAENIPILPYKSCIDDDEKKEERRRKIKLLVKKEFREEYEKQSSNMKDPYSEWIIYSCLVDFKCLRTLTHKNYDDSVKIIRYLCGKMLPTTASSPVFIDGTSTHTL